MQPADLLPGEIARMKKERLYKRIFILIISIIVLIGTYFVVERILNPKLLPEPVGKVQGTNAAKEAYRILFTYIADEREWDEEHRKKMLDRNKVEFYILNRTGHYLMLIIDGTSTEYKGFLSEKTRHNLSAYNLFAAYSWDPQTGTIYKCPELYLTSLKPEELTNVTN